MNTEEEEPKEIYAQFGWVAHRVSHLETVLTSILLAIVKGKGELPTAEDFERMEEQLQNTKPLGGLIREVKTVVSMTSDAESLIPEALRRRNFLMHHFFRERAFEFTTREGRDRLLQELKEAHAYILIATRSAEAVLRDIATRSGITPEAIQEETEQLRQNARQKEHGI